MSLIMHHRNKKENKMNAKGWFIFKLLMFQGFFISRKQDDFDFFYLVLQWPGAYCDTKRSCCYPTSGKPAADFGIHGLWPNYKNGSWPSNCDPNSQFDQSQITDLVSSSMKEKWPTLSCSSNEGFKFWEHEWEKHGTCSESVMDQHDYFETTLKLRDKANLLQILTNSGIKPDDGFYELAKISEAIEDGIGFTAGIRCNKDPERNDQLHEIYICVDTSGTEFIECPYEPRGSCPSQVQFPKF